MAIFKKYTNRDAYVWQRNSQYNYGNGQFMSVGQETSASFKLNGLFSFDLSNVNLDPNNIQSAYVTLDIITNTNDEVFLRRITENWSEGGVTWNNQPAYAFEYYNSFYGVVGSQKLDITNLVKQWVSGTHPNYGIFLETAGLKDTRIRTKEYSDGTYAPQLEINYTIDTPTVISPNGGETLSGNHTVQVTLGSNAVANNFKTKVEYSSDNGSTWSELATLGVGVDSFTYDFFTATETSVGRIRAYHVTDFGGVGDSDQSDGVFTVQHNLPPNPATNLSPNGAVIDRSLVQRLSWTHNDPNPNDTQSKAVIEWKLQGGATWNTINVNSNREYYDVSANTFPAGTITWRVKTFDQLGLESPYSNSVVFTSADPTDAPTITSPTASVSISRPTIQWTVPEQIAYQIIIADTMGDTVWDTGEVASTNKARTVGVDLTNGGQYTVKVRVKNNAALWTEYAIKNITVSYTPPANPNITVTGATGHIVIEIDNTAPSGTQPNVTGNEVYKQIDGEWVRIAEEVLYVPYRDYAVASGKEYTYKVRAIGENGTFSESNVSFASTTFRGVWLHTINNAEVTAYNFRFDGGGRESSWEIQSSIMELKGRKRPMIETGEMTYDRIDFSLTLKDSESKEALERIVKSREIVCYRDGRGRMRFGLFTQMPLSDENWGGYTTSLQLLYIDYSESV